MTTNRAEEDTSFPSKPETPKPGWFKRRVIWNLKKLSRSWGFKVFLLSGGVATYLADVGLDLDSVVRWITLPGCYRQI